MADLTIAMSNVTKMSAKKPSSSDVAPKLAENDSSPPPLGAAPGLSPESYFAERLRDLRQRLIGKQLCLSYAVGCTDAAVSFWESGKRLPQRGTLLRIISALADEGASPAELTILRASWKRAMSTRQHRPDEDCAPDSQPTGTG